MKPKRLAPRLVMVLAAVGIASALAVQGCSSPLANRNPTGEMFPSVTGESLQEQPMELPQAIAGEPAVLLIGYKQRAQFDIDRWLMGLLQAEIQVPIYELPTIPSLVPTMISGWIDDGMRKGIPEEDWGAVITLYGSSAKPVAQLTGTESGNLTRVLVLDAEGRVIWFDDRGYSARKPIAIAELLSSVLNQ